MQRPLNSVCGYILLKEGFERMITDKEYNISFSSMFFTSRGHLVRHWDIMKLSNRLLWYRDILKVYRFSIFPTGSVLGTIFHCPLGIFVTLERSLHSTKWKSIRDISFKLHWHEEMGHYMQRKIPLLHFKLR